MPTPTVADAAAKNRLQAWFLNLDKRLNNTGVGRWLLRQNVTDTVELSKNATHEAPGLLSRIIPGPLKTGWSSFNGMMDKFPGMSRLSGFLKGNMIFEAAFISLSTITDGIKGYNETEGNGITKVFGGVRSAIKSTIKSIGGFAASIGGALLVPALLGVTPMGAVGIIGGMIGAHFAKNFATGMMEKYLPFLAKPGKEGENTQPSEEDRISSLVPNQSGNSIVDSIEMDWKTKDSLKPYLSQDNPWLKSGMANF